MKNGKHNNHCGLDREVNDIRETSDERSPDTRPEMRILKRPFNNLVVNAAEFIEELQP
jgi:hypothetical protein